MTETLEATPVRRTSVLTWMRVLFLVIIVVPVLWFAGANARGIVAELGLYYFDHDLVNGGQTASSAKQYDAVNRLSSVSMEASNYFGDGTSSWMPKDENSQPLHSWMAMALMFNWQGGVTQFIDYQKPWDDPANRDAFSRRVKDYESPFQKLPRKNADGYALAHIAGNVHVFGAAGVQPEANFKDGTAQTILAGDAAGNFEPWGKPRTDRDPALGINRSKAGFGGPWAGGGAMMVFADGSVRMMSSETSPETLRALATPAGNDRAPTDY